jgi:hypothetical protein
MKNEWNAKGCAICRQLWMGGDEPPRLAINVERHAFLHKCSACGALCEQFERYVDIVSEVDARALYDFPQE